MYGKYLTREERRRIQRFRANATGLTLIGLVLLAGVLLGLTAK